MVSIQSSIGLTGLVFKQLFRRQSENAWSLDELRKHRQLPLLNAEQLIILLGQTNRLRAIKRLTAVDDVTYERLFLPAIQHFIQYAQLQPASTVDHHAGLGGLIVHTLEVVESALHERRQHLLPVNASPDVIAREETLWTLAVFSAALLHDAGKLLTLTQLRLDDGSVYSGEYSIESSATSQHYTIEFINGPYELQTRTSIMLLSLIPSVSRTKLFQNQAILDQLSHCLIGILDNTIGQIIQQADALSVRRCKHADSAPATLPAAPIRSLAERMMQALRGLIQSGYVRFNQSGGAGWYDGEHVYLVCGVIANQVRDALNSEGCNDIPTNNNRIFDIWQDHGLLVATPEDKAVWKIKVATDSFSHTLTMLKFKSADVLHDTHSIEPFNGTLHEMSTSPTTVFEQENTRVDKKVDEEQSGNASTRLNKQTKKARKNNNSVKIKHSAQDQKDTTEYSSTNKLTESLEQSIINHRTKLYSAKVPLDHEDIALYFLYWLRQKVATGDMLPNQPSSMLHIIPEGVALVSPRIFQYFVATEGLSPSQSAESLLKSAKRVQNRLRKTNVLITTKKGYSAHTLTFTANPAKTLSVFLLPVSILYSGQALPNTNQSFHALS